MPRSDQTAPVTGATGARMVPLGYGRHVRADRIFALVPVGRHERGEGRRTYVHVDGLAEPLVASRSERAILGDMQAALSDAAGVPRRRRFLARALDGSEG
jgi:hypothetical protein